MRLIDADKLQKVMYHEAFETDSDMQKWDGGCWIRYKMFENAIEAEPVKHGRWTPVTNGRGGFECSICHSYAPSYQDGVEWLSPYCPNCGARMSEGSEE